MTISKCGNIELLFDETLRQLDALGDDFAVESKNLKALKGRLLEGRFHLAVLGQFKRGKSTLLNALLGQAVLPTSVVPLTAIPTFIQAGEKLSAKVIFEDKQDCRKYTAKDCRQLADFVSGYVAESANPENRLKVKQVEIFHPAAILNNGVVLIDTPGIGSTFKHNTEATLNFLGQCDAAVFLVSADPPITEVEIEFLKQVREKVPRLFFILNKADYLTEQEKDEILSFIKKVLTEQVGLEENTDIYCVSAHLGLQARQNQDKALWSKSGLNEVEKYLVDFLANEKTTALHQAVSKKASDILADVLMQIQLCLKSLQMPIDDLEKRLAIFTKKLTEIEQSKLSEMDILQGDKKRTHEFLEEHSQLLRDKAKAYLEGIVEQTFAKAEPQQVSADVIEQAIAGAIGGFFEHEMGKSTKVFQDKMQQTLEPHRSRANELIGLIRKTAADLFEIPYQQIHSGQDFEMARRPYWVSHQWARSFQRIQRDLFNKLLPAGIRRYRLSKRAAEQIDELVIQNVENLRWAVYQNIDKSFIRFEAQLQKRFQQTLTVTQSAIEAALKKRKEHSKQIASELTRLDSVLIILKEIKEAFDA